MPLTNYKENASLDSIFGVTVYMGVSTTTPTKTGTNITEPGDAAYELISVASGDWAAASGGSKTTSATKSFAVATESWGTITHVVFYDDASKTNCIGWAALTTPKTVDADEYLRFVAGEITAAYSQA